MTISHANPGQLLPSEDPAGRIVRVGETQLGEAVERLTGSGGDVDPSHARRFVQFARDNRIDLSHFWARADGRGRLRHSVLCVPSPGRTCMVFASNPATRGEAGEVGGVIDHACRHLHDGTLDLAQALLEPAETLMREAFVAARFNELAMLSYLERPLPTRRSSPRAEWPEGLVVETFRPGMEETIIRLLDETYTDTLDCPGLFGLRRTEDIFEGHRSTGEFDSTLWLVLRDHGAVVGAILLNPAPASRAIELVYMGLSPRVRGRGLGTQLLNEGLSRLAGRREHNVTLAVDERNAPALALYRRAGFRPVLRRRAMIRSLRTHEDAS